MDVLAGTLWVGQLRPHRTTAVTYGVAAREGRFL